MRRRPGEKRLRRRGLAAGYVGDTTPGNVYTTQSKALARYIEDRPWRTPYKCRSRTVRDGYIEANIGAVQDLVGHAL
jgi:hypothetical protein